MPDPLTAFGDDSRPNTRPIYGYVISQVDVADVATLFLTSHDGEFQISGMPDRFAADDPQVFTPANIAHGPIKRESTFDKSTFELKAVTRDISGISRYALTGATPRIRVDIVKINPGPVAAENLVEWGEDTIIVQSGMMTAFGFEGAQVGIECVPEILFAGQEIPRCRFSRTCNWQLYGPGCRVDPAPFSLETNVLEVDPGTRSVVIQGTHPQELGNFFRQGVCLHQPTGMRLSIFSSEVVGTDTLLKLHQWSPDIYVNDVVVVRAGCRHTFEDCKEKFSNQPNFGGFSGVPNKNPSYHGVASR